MRRRTLIQHGIGLTTLGIAGCLETGPIDGTVTTYPSPTTNQSPTQASETQSPPTDAEPYSIQRIGKDCEGPVVATLEGNDPIAVTGTIQSPNPCHSPTVASYIHSDGSLEVTIGTQPDGSDACIECVGYVDYRLTIEPEQSINTLTLKHESQATTRIIAEWTI